MSARRRVGSRQHSTSFNALVFDALPELNTPGGAPDMPAPTPPPARRRVGMSGFTPIAGRRPGGCHEPDAPSQAAVGGADVLRSSCSPVRPPGRPADLSVGVPQHTEAFAAQVGALARQAAAGPRVALACARA